MRSRQFAHLRRTPDSNAVHGAGDSHLSHRLTTFLCLVIVDKAVDLPGRENALAIRQAGCMGDARVIDET